MCLGKAVKWEGYGGRVSVGGLLAKMRQEGPEQQEEVLGWEWKERSFWMSNEEGDQRTVLEDVTNLPGKIFIAAGSSKKA